MYGIPSQRHAGVYHLVDQQSCTCEDAARHPGNACKHMLAVRLHCELAKAAQPKPRATGKVLRMIRADDGSLRWEPEPRPAPTAAEAVALFAKL